MWERLLFVAGLVLPVAAVPAGAQKANAMENPAVDAPPDREPTAFSPAPGVATSPPLAVVHGFAEVSFRSAYITPEAGRSHERHGDPAPRLHRARSPVGPLRALRAALERRTILDDHEGHTKLVRRNLLRSGLNNPIVALPSGTQALDYVFAPGPLRGPRGHGELLTLLDINMPGLAGVEVLRQIKADARTKKVRVLMLSSIDDPQEVNRCYDLGCSVYFAKRDDPSALVVAIQRLGPFISDVSMPSDPARSPT